MALATRCPHCNTIFRVAADQLKLRGGIVRCGSCREVFDGSAALVDPAAPCVPVTQAETIQAPIPPVELHQQEQAALEPEPEPEPELELEPEPELELEPECETGPEPVPVFASEHEFESEAANENRLEWSHPEFAVEHQSVVEADWNPITDEEINAFALPKVASVNAAEPVTSAEPAPEEPEIDEPGFVKRGRRQHKANKTRRILMSIGSLVLMLGLLLQGATTFRNQLAAHMPALKPALMAACAVIGCSVDLPAQIDALTIETGELQTIGAHTFSLTTLLRNQSTTTQAWPGIELVINDASDKPVVRRVLTPQEYLLAPHDLNQGFPASSEQAVKLSFKLDQVTASGYRIAIFYP